jgi:hypothetical protein
MYIFKNETKKQPKIKVVAIAMGNTVDRGLALSNRRMMMNKKHTTSYQ